MKDLLIFVFLFIAFAIFSQEQSVGTSPVEKKEQEQNFRALQIEHILGYWAGVDLEKNIIKIKSDDKILEFKYEKNRIKILGRQKNLKLKDFKVGDFVKLFYKKNEEGVNIATRIIKDPKVTEDTTPSTPGN